MQKVTDFNFYFNHFYNCNYILSPNYLGYWTAKGFFGFDSSCHLSTTRGVAFTLSFFIAKRQAGKE